MAVNWTLRGGRWALGPCEAERRDVFINDGAISAEPPAQAQDIDTGDCLISPGRINAHDHLDFALFPRLGDGPYTNAAEWAHDVYKPTESPLAEHLCVPYAQRLWWGALRNLLAGATTVCHHNPYEAEVFQGDFPVRVPEVGWAHSLWGAKEPLDEAHRRVPAGAPFIIHAAEGVDRRSRQELYQLHSLGVVRPGTVLVHCVALKELDWQRARGVALSAIWCPTSNLFLLGRTLLLSPAMRNATLALGTDSSLTAAGDLIDEMQSAQAICSVSPQLLYSMTGHLAAGVLQLPPSDAADLAVYQDAEAAPCDTALDRETLAAVFVGGRLRAVERRFAEERGVDTGSLQPLRYGDNDYWVAADVEALLDAAHAELGDEIRLGGRAVELWR